MSDKNAPAAKAKPGEPVVFGARDCYGNQYKTGSEPDDSIDKSLINPATGPLYIETAAPGDVLKITIEKITLTGRAMMEKKYFFDVDETHLIFDETTGLRLRLPLNPMIGVIGTAPKSGTDVPTHTPGEHGGNMDCGLITEGSVVYLPVNAPGGLLSLGDLHAVMGDGEVSDFGAEIGGEVTLRVDVCKSTLPTPAVVSKKAGVAAIIASAKTLDEAATTVIGKMKTHLVASGREENKARMLLSLASDLKVCQIVNPLKTMRLELPLELFPIN